MKSPIGLIQNSVSRISLAVLLASAAMGGSVLATGSFAFAEEAAAVAPEHMDAETHTVVIEKLEESLKRAKEDETVSLVPVRARLADLYADRARLRAMDEAAKSCQDCKGAFNDRIRALELYAVVVKDAAQKDKGALFMQMAHLDELTNQPKKSDAIYAQVANEGLKKHNKDIVAEATIGRAETYFADGKLEKSEADFNEAIRLSPSYRRGALLNRVAWVHLNQGKQKQAVQDLTKILKTPALLQRNSSDGPKFDASFQEDVARDLATFMARGPVSMKEIRQLEAMTPDRTKGETMKYFASECDRLGQKPAAIDAWAVAAQYEKNPSEHIEALIRVAQLRFDLGQRPQALAGMKTAVEFWKKNACLDPKNDDEEKQAGTCDQLQARLRKLVIDWDRLDRKSKLSGQLYEAYLTYLSKFGDDAEMNRWAADVARSLKRYQEASDLYHKASLLVAGKPGKDMKVILEASTVGEIEMAELTKNKDSREAAYEHYLALNPHGSINEKVRYQRAHISYERGQSREASNRFHEFAASEVCRPAHGESVKLCSQATDLDLDSLALLKDHPMIEKRSLEYASVYPARRDEFLKLSRTAVFKQTELMEPRAALAKLVTANLTGANADERIRFYKTQISLAEKAQDLDQVRSAASNLMKVKGLSADDHQYAMARIAWASEMSLDFNEAYIITKMMKQPKMDPADRAMKLSLLAELAGKNPRQHQEEFLRVSHNQGKNALVRAKMVRSAKSPASELRKQEAELRRFPEIYATLSLEVFARTGDQSIATRALQTRGVAQQPAGQAMRRELFLREFAKLDHKISSHKIRAYSDAIMQSSLSERLKLLAQLEQAGNAAITSGDWPSQIVVLAVASRENQRIYGEILALPIPRKLKGAQRQAYTSMVASQAAPYLAKHNAIEQKLQGFWSNTAAFDAMAADYVASRPEVRPMVAREVRTIEAKRSGFDPFAP